MSLAILKSVYIKPTVGGVLLFLLALPGMLLLARLLSFALPDAIYYPVSGYRDFLELTPLLVILPLFGWPLCHGIASWISGLPKAWRVSLRLVLCVVIVAVTLVGGVVAFWAPGRFNVGHPYCQTPLLQQVERCEGVDRGFLQDRISAVAMSGPVVGNISDVVATFPEYNLFQVECADLAGGFGERCYAGSHLRSTGDTNFLNLYLSGSRGLVLITENIPPVKRSADAAEHQIFNPDMLDDFVDLTRFDSGF